MTKIQFFEIIKHLFFPSSCVICGEPVEGNGVEICDKCRTAFLCEKDVLCPKCGKKAPYCTCSIRYLRGEAFHGITAAVCRFYNPDHDSDIAAITRQLILREKRESKQAIANLLSVELSARVGGILRTNGEDPRDWTVTWAPRNPENLLRFGFDHGEMIASAIADRLGCSVSPTMFRFNGKTQKEISTGERYANAVKGLTPRRNAVVQGGKYILVDDVLTTGATMNAAASLLYECGAVKVLPAAIAKTMMIK